MTHDPVCPRCGTILNLYHARPDAEDLWECYRCGCVTHQVPRWYYEHRHPQWDLWDWFDAGLIFLGIAWVYWRC